MARKQKTSKYKHDPELYEKRLSYVALRGRAKRSKTPFTLTWEQFLTLWDGKWHLKGQGIDRYLLTRKDLQSPYTYENMQVCLQQEKPAPLKPWYADPVMVQKRRAYNLMKAQAKYRHEEFKLTWKGFKYLWEYDWEDRGRKSHSKCLVRINPDEPWTLRNSQILTREQARKHAQEYINRRKQALKNRGE